MIRIQKTLRTVHFGCVIGFSGLGFRVGVIGFGA